MLKYLYALTLLALSINSHAQITPNSADEVKVFSGQAASIKDKSAMDISQASQFKDAELTIQAQQKIKLFAATLKQALVSAIQSDGLAHAVDVCHTVAPEIGASLSSDGWQVSRTSLKARNADNRADQWESQMLEDFDSRYKAGVDTGELTAFLSNEEQFRYMKAIPMDQVCLACHGPAVDSALSEVINKQYPNDQAVGFTLQDIRGAFTLSRHVVKK